MSMLVEYKADPASAKMTEIDVDTTIRIWSEDRAHYIDIRVTSNRTGVIISHFQAPGGFSYAESITIHPNGTHSIFVPIL